MYNNFAVGFWGRVAQYGSATLVIVAVITLIVAWLFRNDYPDTVAKVRKWALWLGMSVPIAVALFAAVSIALFALSALVGYNWF